MSATFATREALVTNKVIIMGAAGRDFHDFNVYWKHRPDVEVVCFTATSIFAGSKPFGNERSVVNR